MCIEKEEDILENLKKAYSYYCKKLEVKLNQSSLMEILIMR